MKPLVSALRDENAVVAETDGLGAGSTIPPTTKDQAGGDTCDPSLFSRESAMKPLVSALRDENDASRGVIYHAQRRGRNELRPYGPGTTKAIFEGGSSNEGFGGVFCGDGWNGSFGTGAGG